MHPITLNEVRIAVGGRGLSVASGEATLVRSVSTDTRTCEPSALFVALEGDARDGHAFLREAAARGAVAAIVRERPKDAPPNLKYVEVHGCTRAALGRLAAHVRRSMEKCKVVAVGGSNGKTSTKHLVGSALAAKLTGSVSPKSYNNDIGVPLTIFPADPRQDFLVLELGTNGPGEVSHLTNLAQPDVAVITNCSAEHLEGLGDLRGVRQEEASIVEGLRPGGLLVAHGDDPDLLDACEAWQGKRVTFGFGPHNDLFATDVRLHADGTSFRLNGRGGEVWVPMLGRHSALNALAAVAVARRFGVAEDDVVRALATSSRPEMRLQPMELCGVRVLNDAYNANPASVRAALDTFCSLPTTGRRVAVLGDMRELGDHGRRYHRELGAFVETLGLHEVAFVGPCARWAGEAALEAGFAAGRLHFFETSADAAAAVPGFTKPGDSLLLKGSRGVRLETVVEALRAAEEQPRMRLRA